MHAYQRVEELELSLHGGDENTALLPDFLEGVVALFDWSNFLSHFVDLVDVGAAVAFLPLPVQPLAHGLQEDSVRVPQLSGKHALM